MIEGAFQFDATEKGFTVKDFYGRIVDPFSGWVGFQGGIFLRPFGYESPAPPAYHESPEFSRMNQTIMPNEVELGEAIVIEAPDNFKKKYFDLRVDASLVNGEGIGVATTAASASASNPSLTVPVPPISGVNATGAYESKKDFIGRIKMGKVFTLNGETKIGISGSASYYYGGVLQTTKNVYELKTNSNGNLVYTNVGDSGQIAKVYYKREYYGAHLQFDAWYKFGGTMLRAEFIGGTQPGTSKSTAVPEAYGTTLGTSSVPGQDLYIRKFNGLMFYLTQTIKHKIKGHPVAHEFTFKYDFYNPNIQVSQKDLSTINDIRVSAADVKYQTYGIGYTFKPADYFKLMLWYDIVQNSTSNIKGFTSDLKDNVLTIRTQFMFDSFWFNKH